MAASSQKISREALYGKVWSTPMRTLAAEFGLSNTGLAKLCARHDIPRPPQGYWAKLAVGKIVPQIPLPDAKSKAAEIQITPTVKADRDRSSDIAAAATRVALQSVIALPTTLDEAHPRVKALVREHKQAQASRQQKLKHRGPEWGRPELLPDLTERDIERLKATSALIVAAERAGLQTSGVEITGKLTFKADGHSINLVLIERMRRGLKPLEGDAKKWSAFYHRHQPGLHPTGRLKVEIKTHLGSGVKVRWEEKACKPISIVLAEVVATLSGAAARIDAIELEREKWRRSYEEQRAREAEARRLKEQDEARWKQFRELAFAQEECERLNSFIAALKLRMDHDGELEIDGQSISAWITWAENKVSQMDPLTDGLRSVFALRHDPWRYRF